MQISLLSPAFLGLAFVAVVAVQALRGTARQVVFLGLNLVFVWGMLLGPAGAIGTLAFAFLGWGLIQLVLRKGLAGLVAGVILYVAVFVYMRRYDFLVYILPESMLTRVLSTVGLSFLFFKIVHVMVDAFGGTIERLRFVTYLNYVLNFTTFMMGPIQRYQDYSDQWDGKKEPIPADFESHLDAVLRVLAGLAKAYVLAPIFQDRALQPDAVLTDLSLIGLVVQSYAFWAYLYLNFAGYCDVVIGTGSLLGVRPPENFNKPFLARNISDFWLRQHRSLTLWLTDYVFTPLYKHLLTGHGRHRIAMANVSLMVTMMVSGLWHGTTLSFFLFGLVHGLWFVLYRSWDELLIRALGRSGAKRFRRNPATHAAGMVLTFNATAIAFVFFQVRPQEFVDLFRRLLA